MKYFSFIMLYLSTLLFISPVVAQDDRDDSLVLSSRDMHSTSITQIVIDPANKVLITASDDKSIRIWQLPTGRFLKKIEPPSGAGNLGKIFALAISPDGKRLASAGYTGKKNPRQVEEHTYYDWEIYIHDLASGKLMQTIDTPALIDHLSYSDSGDLLLASLSAVTRRVYDVDHPKSAVQIFRTSDYSRINNHRFRHYQGVAEFGRNGQLIVIGKPGGYHTADLFNSDFDVSESRSFPGVPWAISVAPDGSKFAVATWGPSVGVYSTDDLSRLHKQDMTGIKKEAIPPTGVASRIAWSADGEFLYMVGSTTCGDQGCWIRKWRDQGRGSYVDIMVSKHPVTHLFPLKEGGLAFATAGPSFGIIDSKDQRSLYVENAAIRAANTQVDSDTEIAAEPKTSQVAKENPAGQDEGLCISVENDFMPFGSRILYKSGKWVYLDKTGKVVMALPFRSVSGFSEGRARIVRGNKAGFIDRSGSLLIPATFDFPVSDFAEGRAAVTAGNKIGYINRTGQTIIKHQFNNANKFSDGLARVRWPETRLWGYVNTVGEVVIPPKFEFSGEFRERVAVVMINGKWGYIDPTGQWLIEPKFSLAIHFSEGLARVKETRCTQRNCKYSFIDKSGEAILQGIPFAHDGWFSEGMAVVHDASYRFGFIDRTGSSVISPQYQSARPFMEGLAAVKTFAGHWGYIDKQGTFVIPAQFEQAMSFAGGMAAVKNKKWGYIDNQGKLVVATQLEEARSFSEGLAAACISNEDLSAFKLPATLIVTAKKTTVSTEAKRSADDPFEVPIRKPRPVMLNADDQAKLREMHETVVQLLQSRHYVKALPIARRAVELVKLKLTPDDPALIQPLLDQARVNHVIGNYHAAARGSGFSIDEYRLARSNFERVLDLKQQSKIPDLEETAEILEKLSDLNARSKKFDTAMDHKQRVLQMRKTANGEQHRSVLEAVNDLDAIRVAKFSNKLSKALPLAHSNLQYALEIDAQHPNVARAQVNLARIYLVSRLKLQSSAFNLFEQALELRRIILGEDHWDTVMLKVELGGLYLEIERYSKAERLFAQAITTEEKILGPDDPDVMKLVYRYGITLMSAGSYQKAINPLQRVLVFWNRQLESNKSNIRSILKVRDSLETLADSYRLMGDYAIAERYYQRFLATKNQFMDMKIYDVARIERKLGTIYRLQGDYVAAEVRYREALAVLEPKLPSPSTSVMFSLAETMTKHTLEELSALAVARGKPKVAHDLLLRAEFYAEREYNSLLRSGSESDLLKKLQSSTQYYYQVLWLVSHHLHNVDNPVAWAFNLVLAWKGILLDLQSRIREAQVTLNNSSQKKRRKLSRYRSELSSLMHKGPKVMNEAAYEKKLIHLFEQIQTLEAALTSNWEITKRVQELLAKVTKQEIITSLPKQGALIEFVRIPDINYAQYDFGTSLDNPDQYLAFVLTSSGQLALIDLGSAELIDKLVNDIQSKIRGSAKDLVELKILLRDTYDAVWSPLISALGDTKTIIISPDSELHRLPFAALVDVKDRFVIEQYELNYVGSSRDLVSKSHKRAEVGAELVLVADPDFNDQSTSTVESSSNTIAQARTFNTQFNRLPGTAKEARLIPPLIPGGQQQKILLLGSQATEQAVKQVAHPRIFHIATHGFYLPQEKFGLESSIHENSLINSGLVLAGANNVETLSTDSDDGLLTALELMDIDLTGTELVVLSACDTGVGKVTEGQGVFGLRRAFTIAGAKNVLMSLWPVDDVTTAKLMENFYRNLQQMSPAKALRQAQLSLLSGNSTTNGTDRGVVLTTQTTKHSDHPYYWAPFFLTVNGL